MQQSIYDFKVDTIDGTSMSLEEYRGKVLLIVNVASKCGFTPQYAGLQKLYETYKDKGLEVLGFPANNFLWQEPGSNEEISQFCSLEYGVSFPMFSKVSVKGRDQHPLYAYLTDSKLNPEHAGDGTDRIFVVQQRGVITVFPNDSLVTSGDTRTFLDIQSKIDDSFDEEGLLGLAFHPDYANNGYFFVNYTANGPNRNVIARYKVSDTDPNVAEPDSELVIIEISKPFSNHNAGQLAFGDDGYLYIATGDGGSGGDPQNHGQRRTTDLGNMVRMGSSVQVRSWALFFCQKMKT